MFIRQTLFEDLFEKKWLERRVQLFSDVLKQQRIAETDAVLEMSCVVSISQLDDCQVVITLHVLCPTISLTLWIYHQWPTLHTNRTAVSKYVRK